MMDRYELHYANINNIENLAYSMPHGIKVENNIKKIEGTRIYFFDASGNKDEDVYYDVVDGDVNSYDCCTKIQEYELKENLTLFYGMYARTVIGDLI